MLSAKPCDISDYAGIVKPPSNPTHAPYVVSFTSSTLFLASEVISPNRIFAANSLSLVCMTYRVYLIGPPLRVDNGGNFTPQMWDM